MMGRRTKKTSWDPSGGGTRLARQEAFGHGGVYQLTNVFSHPDFRGFSIKNDHEETASGSATKSVVDGKLEISTGTTAGSVYRYETAEFGVYQAGKEAVGGVGVGLDQGLSGTAAFSAGLGDDKNGCFLRRKGDGTTEAVLRIKGTDSAVSQSNWNRDKLDGSGDPGGNPSGLNLDLTTRGVTVAVRYNWYSWGSITLVLWFVSRNPPHQTLKIPLHTFQRDGLDHFETPQLPLFVELDNGDQATDFTAKIGGRRFDIMGEFEPTTRVLASRLRESQTVGSASGIVPLVAFQRKSAFPTGVNNTIKSFIQNLDVRTDQKLEVAFYTVPGSGDLTNSNFTGFDNVSAEETSLQGDISATAISNQERLGEKRLFDGTGNNKSELSTEKGLRVPIIRDRPTVLAANNLTNTDATVDTLVSAREFL